MLKTLRAVGLGPVSPLDLELGERLGVVTGDNGLGKTFLLDLAWSATTGEPPRLLPRPDADTARIDAKVGGGNAHTSTVGFSFRFDSQTWQSNSRNGGIAPLCVYAEATGAVRVWDPARGRAAQKRGEGYSGLVLASADLVEGHPPGAATPVCNGLIRDWVSWQRQHEVPGTRSVIFQSLLKALEQVSPEGEPLRPGSPLPRLSLDDSREHPTIVLPYGAVPVVHLSAGYRRILSLVYALVWAWYEHVQVSALLRQPTTGSVTLLVDEVEAHLHPRWQRRIVASLLAAVQGLTESPVQLLLTTHSPLVLASLEPSWDEDRDRLFALSEQGVEVRLEQVAWFKRGDAVDWLTDPQLFGLQQARSTDAERAIEAAEAWERREITALPDDLKTREAIDAELKRVLGQDDHFWPRWLARGRDAS